MGEGDKNEINGDGEQQPSSYQNFEPSEFKT